MKDLLLGILLALLFVATVTARGEELQARCWTETMNNIDCKIYPNTDKVLFIPTQLVSYDYFISDTAEIDGVLYVLLLQKEK